MVTTMLENETPATESTEAAMVESCRRALSIEFVDTH